MSAQPPPPPSSSVSNEYRPEKFVRTTSRRDYLNYLMLGVIAAVVLGAAGYYLTRPEAEQKRIVARLRGITGDEEGTVRVLKLKEPAIADVMEPTTPAPAAAPARKTEPGATAAGTGYAGSRPSRVLASDDPKLPAAGPEFRQFAENLKVNGVFQGTPVRAILNGGMFKVGATINAELAVTLADADITRKILVLRDKSGAELRVTY